MPKILTYIWLDVIGFGLLSPGFRKLGLEQFWIMIEFRSCRIRIQFGSLTDLGWTLLFIFKRMVNVTLPLIGWNGICFILAIHILMGIHVFSTNKKDGNVHRKIKFRLECCLLLGGRGWIKVKYCKISFEKLSVHQILKVNSHYPRAM